MDQEDRTIMMLTEVMLGALVIGVAFAFLVCVSVVAHWAMLSKFSFAAGCLSLGVFVVAAIMLVMFMMGEE